MKKYEKNFKKIITAGICVMMLVSTMGMTALAAQGMLTVGKNDNYYTVTLMNTSGNTRYCVVALRQYDRTPADYIKVSSRERSLPDNSSIKTGGVVTKNHAYGVGIVYYSGEPESGAQWEDSIVVK